MIQMALSIVIQRPD